LEGVRNTTLVASVVLVTVILLLGLLLQEYFLEESLNNLLIFFITPFVIYIFIKSDFKKISHSQLQKIISYSVLFLLASTILVTPYGISYSYWPSVFASSDNPTNSTENLSPSNSTQIDDESSVEIITSFCDFTTNSTTHGCIEKFSIIDEIHVILYSTNLDYMEKFSIIDKISVIINSTNSTFNNVVTEAEDIQLEMENKDMFEKEEMTLYDGFEFSGNATISETIQNTTSLILDGEDDYVQMSVNSTNHVTQMTLSTWIKPDYSAGSLELTILSKEKSFELSINNIISPEKIVKFSVFDGIKWNTVESYQTIPEDWTHVTVSYDNDQIKIYVNGELDNSKNIHGLSYIVINDYLDLSTIDAITSESNIIIGAYIETRHASPIISKQFSGEIIDIQFFKEVLDEIQVSALYVSSIDEIVYEVTNDEVLLEHEPIEIGKPGIRK